jgi:hypothetical protein
MQHLWTLKKLVLTVLLGHRDQSIALQCRDEMPVFAGDEFEVLCCRQQ